MHISACQLYEIFVALQLTSLLGPIQSRQLRHGLQIRVLAGVSACGLADSQAKLWQIRRGSGFLMTEALETPFLSGKIWGKSSSHMGQIVGWWFQIWRYPAGLRLFWVGTTNQMNTE